jgi:hypothetical protein
VAFHIVRQAWRASAYTSKDIITSNGL